MLRKFRILRNMVRKASKRSPTGPLLRPREAARPAGRSSRVISATRAAKSFGSLVDRVREEQAEYVVERGGRPVARIVPAAGVRGCTVADLIVFLRAGPRADAEYLTAVEKGVAFLNRPAVPEDRWER